MNRQNYVTCSKCNTAKRTSKFDVWSPNVPATCNDCFDGVSAPKVTTKNVMVCTVCQQSKNANHFSMYESDQPVTCNGCCKVIQYNALWNKKELPTSKVCKRCQITKPIADYYDLKGAKDGKHYSCKACMQFEKKKRKEAA